MTFNLNRTLQYSLNISIRNLVRTCSRNQTSSSIPVGANTNNHFLGRDISKAHMTTIFSKKEPIAFSQTAASKAGLNQTVNGVQTAKNPRTVVVLGALGLGFIVYNIVFGIPTEWPEHEVLAPLKHRMEVSEQLAQESLKANVQK